MAEQSSFYLKVIATQKVFFSGKATDLIIQTVDGQIAFLAHHEEMIVAMEPGELSIRTEKGEWIHIVAGYGSMMFANNRATVLIETCETQEELDARRAEEALDRAKEKLRQKQSMAEYRITQAAMARALSRLKFKGKYIN